MKKIALFLATFCIVFTSYSQNQTAGRGATVMTMTTASDNMSILLAGTGAVTIDFG